MATLAPHLVFSYPIAYAIGFLSFITPSGFGVREGAFFVLLSPILSGGVVTVIALAMRLWTTAGELVMAGAGVLLAPAEPAGELQDSGHPADGASADSLGKTA